MEGQSEKKGYPVTAAEYKLLEEIGHGVSATVYRAICLPYNDVVGIKSLDLERCNSNLDDIRREAMTMSLINHPNVVKAYCSFVVDQSLWVVMPYMAGGSCLHIMKAAYPDGFEEPVIATVLKESLKALEYLHRHGHIHRDVKAGNILVDANGAVKLGDFGVSACMFDTGDRQRSRNTFVGTPCWMAPEVMEQLHGYDFKADIWSFGITALELAHGHAPFSKYPPMKVLLMTLQNAPPGLDYERDRRFSKSFKEMIAMCLVKDPLKRPTAEKLLRHSFFKNARTVDYIYRHVLEGLPPLGERVKNLKITDAALLAQKKMPFGEQEERSQSEYKRGVSSWNFNVEDLKAQAALIPEDDFTHQIVKEDDDLSKKHAQPGKPDESADTSPQYLSPSLQPPVSQDASSDRLQLPVTIQPLKAGTATDAGDRVIRGRSGPLPNPVQPTKSTNDSKPVPTPGRREPKHIGRFDVFDGDTDMESPSWLDSPKNEQRKGEEKEQARREREDNEHRKNDERERREEQREQRRFEDRERDESRRVGGSGAPVPEHVFATARGRDEEKDRDRDKEYRQSGRLGEDALRHRERPFSGPLLPTGERAVVDHRPANGVQGAPRPSSGNKEATEEKLKAPVQKGPAVQRGRFSVTSDDGSLEDPPHTSTRRNAGLQTTLICKSASVGDWTSERKLPASQQPQQSVSIAPPSNINSATVPVVSILPHLQNALHLAVMQQDALMHVLNGINPSEAAANSLRINNTSKYSRSSSINTGSDHSMMDVSTDRERDLLQQVSELQGKVAILGDELQTVKLRNVGLERKLNAIYNKEEEERIRKEEAAKEDG